jgi:hypothetical protein
MGIDPNFRGGPLGAGLPQQHKNTKAEGFFYSSGRRRRRGLHVRWAEEGSFN